MISVTDVHSQLSRTEVADILRPDSLEAVQEAVCEAARNRISVCVCGGRYSSGGQQFATSGMLIDMTSLNRIISFDPEKGLIEVEGGIRWPELIDYLVRAQEGLAFQWGILQKQTGADRLTIGGTVSANSHGRGLRLRPFIASVESLTLVDAKGEVVICSRTTNNELFRLAVGGFGLFGVVVSVTLRLAPRQVIQRIVEFCHIKDLMPTFERHIAQGCLFGDFQFAIDDASEDFLVKGIVSVYRPVTYAVGLPSDQAELSVRDWMELAYLTHTDKSESFRRYSAHYLSTSGQLYWSDTHQLSTYVEGYHELVDRRQGAVEHGSEILMEMYVPRDRLVDFIEMARKALREIGANVIYGTIRLIEKDSDTFLAWAKESFACIVMNLHTPHTTEGLENAQRAYRMLIDIAHSLNGGYSLAYHSFATREQVEVAFPKFLSFLRLKKQFDPAEVFQSNWYRHYSAMFAGALQ